MQKKPPRKSKSMTCKIQFFVVVTYKQDHKIHYGCIDYEEGCAVFDLSNRTDGESVSDYPLLRDGSYRRERSLWSTVTVAAAKCQPFLSLHTSKQPTEHLEGISTQADNMWSKVHTAFIWGLKALAEDRSNMLLLMDYSSPPEGCRALRGERGCLW